MSCTPNEKTLQLPISKKTVRMRELTVEEMEAVSSRFTLRDIQNGHAQRYDRECAAATIVEVDGKTVDQAEFNPKSEFPMALDWTDIQKTYWEIGEVLNLGKVVGQAKRLATEFHGEILVAKLPGGREVGVRSLTIDEKERIEVGGRFTERQWLDELHAKAAAAICQVDGQPVDPSVFKPKVTFPLNRDWNVLLSLYRLLNEDRSAMDFLPSGRS